MRLLIMGPPGAGKGSQAVLIKDFYKIPSISTGDMFREEINNDTDLGKLANTYISQGNLVPDDVTVDMVRARLKHDDCLNGFLLDGFPRNVSQADALDLILKEMNIKLDAVINLEVDDALLISRISGRRLCRNCNASYHLINHPPKVEGVCDICGKQEIYQRKDDNEETVKNRLNVYYDQTEPLLEYYQNKNLLINFDGAKGITNTFKEIKEVLAKISGGFDDFN